MVYAYLNRIRYYIQQNPSVWPAIGSILFALTCRLILSKETFAASEPLIMAGTWLILFMPAIVKFYSLEPFKSQNLIKFVFIDSVMVVSVLGFAAAGQHSTFVNILGYLGMFVGFSLLKLVIGAIASVKNCS